MAKKLSARGFLPALQNGSRFCASQVCASRLSSTRSIDRRSPPVSTRPSRHYFPTRLLAALVALQACSDPTGPQLPADAVQLQPLAPYRTWWALMENCSGLTGNFDGVTWFSSLSGRVDGQAYAG